MDITDTCRELIVKAYQEYETKDYREVLTDGTVLVCKSKVLNSLDFGYSKIVVESPLLNDDGTYVLKKKCKVADTSKRDTENVPLSEDIEEYFVREVLSYNPDAWIDKTKTKIGYEIPFTRTFYEYQAPEAVDEIIKRINILEKDISESLDKLFHKEV